MTFLKGSFVNFLIFTIAFTEVATWTIDLPEVRKFLFEKNEKYKEENKNGYEDYVTNNDQTFYSNIEGNSKHNSFDKDKYADDDYHTYMEKKVYDIVRDGSKYLEGLQISLEEYGAILENCNRRNSSMQNNTSSNSTAWRPSYDPPSSPMSSNISNSSNSILNFDNYEISKVPLRPNATESRRPNNRRPSRRMSCEDVTEASENVRRYSDLALWTTKRLQDFAHATKYQKIDEQEENELVLKLAWFLDRLAYLTGYEPDHKEYEPRESRTSTIAPTLPTLVPSSEELTKEMMDCLRRNSSEPATVRCRYPMQLPDLMSQLFNSSGTTPSSRTSPDSSVIPMNSPSDNIPAQSSEILITADNSYPNTLSPPKSLITKRSTDYTYYFPPKPLHELTYPSPIIRLIKHRLSNIKAVVKTIVERRLAHIAEKNEENKHFDKRSIDDTVEQTSNYINPLSNNLKPIVKSVEKRPLDDVGSPLGLIHYPVSDVSVINTKSFKKRSIDERKSTFNHINRLSNLESVVKSVEKGPIGRKMFENFLSSTNKVKRTSKSPVQLVKSVKKRYTDNPMSKLANYYIKYKVWDNSNPTSIKKDIKKKSSIFEINNYLSEPKIIHKRSLFNKKVIHLHVPKPLQIFRTYAHGYKHQQTIHKPNLLLKLQKLHDLKHKKLEKNHKNIKKRSLRYEHMYLPRESANPQGDISYYVKNKEGTNYNPSLVQAARVRLGLEQIFQTGNIEVVRRYGANYNPLNPAPFYSGILASMADAK